LFDYVFQWREAFSYVPYFLGGMWVTFHLSFLGFWSGCLVGLFGALGKTYGGPIITWIVNAYVIMFTNTPGLVTAFFIFYGLPEYGILLSPYETVLLNAMLNAGAYITEIMRGGFLSVRATEMEAAQTLGFSMLQSLRLVIVPHIAKVLFAPLSNFYIWIILGSSGASIFGVEELTGRAFNVASETFRAIEIFSITAGFYVILTIIASAVLAYLGRVVFRVKAKIF
jgi:polar amino acid transport system permease protein